MERITNKDIEYQLKILNKKSNNPINVWPYKDNIGNIHTSNWNGYTNIHRTVNENGGVTALARGLTKREAYNWIKASITGIELMEESNA